MKRIIVLAMTVTTMMTVLAQKEIGTFTVYPRVGMNLSKFSGQKIYYDASNNYVKEKYKMGLSAGAELWYQFRNSLALSAGLIESGQGTKWEDYTSEYRDKEGKMESKWIYYFFFLMIFYLCELTVLFPLKWLLGKIDFCMFPTFKALIALWLYYPDDKNGIKLIENIIGDKLEIAFVRINGIVGKYAEKLGIQNKDIAATQKKTE